MNVLLIEDVEKLGWLGDVVDVRDGYARNYLLPHGLAMVPTEANIKSLATEKTHRSEQRRLERNQKEQVAAAVEGAEVVLSAKANDLGHLFGSIAERDIAENLRQQGFTIQDAMVQMPGGHIKELGAHEIALKIGQDLHANIQVIVVSQDETVDVIEEQTDTKAEQDAD